MTGPTAGAKIKGCRALIAVRRFQLRSHIIRRRRVRFRGLCRSVPRERSSLSEVIIHEDENFERALKRFKKKCEKAGILSDLRKHRHYEKPSERRKRKMNAAVRKNRRTRQG